MYRCGWQHHVQCHVVVPLCVHMYMYIVYQISSGTCILRNYTTHPYIPECMLHYATILSTQSATHPKHTHTLGDIQYFQCHTYSRQLNTHSHAKLRLRDRYHYAQVLVLKHTSESASTHECKCKHSQEAFELYIVDTCGF